MDNYLPIFVLLVLGFLFAALSFTASAILAPRRPSVAKAAPYECGIVPRNEPPERFPVRFYLVAMIFIVFDIEIVFLYPWAVEFRALGTFGLVEILVFAAAVVIAFLYLLSNGALEWGPARRSAHWSSARTTASTVLHISPAPSDPRLSQASGGEAPEHETPAEELAEGSSEAPARAHPHEAA